MADCALAPICGHLMAPSRATKALAAKNCCQVAAKFRLDCNAESIRIFSCSSLKVVHHLSSKTLEPLYENSFKSSMGKAILENLGEQPKKSRKMIKKQNSKVFGTPFGLNCIFNFRNGFLVRNGGVCFGFFLK